MGVTNIDMQQALMAQRQRQCCISMLVALGMAVDQLDDGRGSFNDIQRCVDQGHRFLARKWRKVDFVRIRPIKQASRLKRQGITV